MKLKIYILYVLLFFAALGVFAWWLFPRQGAGAFVTEKLNAPGGPLSRVPFRVSVGKIGPSLPLGVKLGNLSVFWDSGKESPEMSVFVHVPVFSIFKRPLPVLVEGRPAHGLIKLQLQAPDVHPGSWELKQIQIEDMAFSDVVVHPSSGDLRLQGYAGLTFDQAEQIPAKIGGGLLHTMSGQGTIQGRDIQADMSDFLLSLINLSSLTFSRMEGRFQMDGGRCKLTQCLLKGPVIHLSLSGHIDLVNDPGQSRLFLDARVLPQSPHIEKLARNPLVRMQFPDLAAAGLSFHIRGTLEHPEPSL